MGGGEGDVGGGRRTVGRDTGREIEVEEGEVTVIHTVDERFAAGVVRSRIPTIRVGVEIAHEDCITVGEIEKRSKVRRVSSGA